MKRLSWVKFYMTDWMIGVRRMSWAARGIYMEALALQFHGERLDVGFDAWQELFPGILESDYWQVVRHFEEREEADGTVHFVNRRLEAEMDASKVKSDKAREAAKRSHSGRSANALRTQSERSAIRGEERREEEKRIKDSEYISTEVVGKAPRKRGRPADPLIWTPSGFVGITDEDKAAWATAYPDVAIERDIVAAHQHIVGHTEKQGMRKWRRFLVDWLARSQRWANEAKAKGSATPKRTRVHIAADAHPDYEHEWFMPNGFTPRYPLFYHDITGREKENGGGYVDEAPSQGDTDENDQ